MTLTKGSLDFTCVKKVVNLKAVSGDIQFKTLLHNKGIALEFVVTICRETFYVRKSLHGILQKHGIPELKDSSFCMQIMPLTLVDPDPRLLF